MSQSSQPNLGVSKWLKNDVSMKITDGDEIALEEEKVEEQRPMTEKEKKRKDR